MRGRTNILNSGNTGISNIKGNIEQYQVYSGETIEQGDFVEFQYSSEITKLFDKSSINGDLMVLSDGRYLLFHAGTIYLCKIENDVINIITSKNFFTENSISVHKLHYYDVDTFILNSLSSNSNTFYFIRIIGDNIESKSLSIRGSEITKNYNSFCIKFNHFGDVPMEIITHTESETHRIILSLCFCSDSTSTLGYLCLFQITLNNYSSIGSLQNVDIKIISQLTSYYGEAIAIAYNTYLGAFSDNYKLSGTSKKVFSNWNITYKDKKLIMRDNYNIYVFTLKSFLQNEKILLRTSEYPVKINYTGINNLWSGNIIEKTPLSNTFYNIGITADDKLAWQKIVVDDYNNITSAIGYETHEIGTFDSLGLEPITDSCALSGRGNYLINYIKVNESVNDVIFLCILNYQTNTKDYRYEFLLKLNTQTETITFCQPTSKIFNTPIYDNGGFYAYMWNRVLPTNESNKYIIIFSNGSNVYLNTNPGVFYTFISIDTDNEQIYNLKETKQYVKKSNSKYIIGIAKDSGTEGEIIDCYLPVK